MLLEEWLLFSHKERAMILNKTLIYWEFQGSFQQSY